MAKAVPIAAGLALSQMGKDSGHMSTATNTVNPWAPTAPYLSGGVQDLTRIYLGNQGGGFGTGYGGGMAGGAGMGAGSGTPGVGSAVPGGPGYSPAAPAVGWSANGNAGTAPNSVLSALGANTGAAVKMPMKTVTIWDPSIRKNTDTGGSSGGYRTTQVPIPDPTYISNMITTMGGGGGGQGGGGGGSGIGGGMYGNTGGYNPFALGGTWDTANQEYMKTLKGDYLNNIQDNPYINNVINRAMGDVASRFEGYGRYGSGANADAMMQAAGELRYQDYANRYNQERQAQLAAMGNAPAWAQTPYQLNAASVAAPYENIKQYLGLLSPLGAGLPTNSASTPYYTNPLGQALGAASSGVGMYSQLNNAGAFSGKGGGGAGAVGTAAGGYAGGGFGAGVGTAAGGLAGAGGKGAAAAVPAATYLGAV